MEQIKSIVIADDSKLARTVVKRCLEIVGLDRAEFFEAEDGEEALDIVGSNSIDLVVTDINMPKLDGWGLLKRIKSSLKLNHISVIVISSSHTAAKEESLLGKGAYKVLKKPVSPQDLATALQSLIDFNNWE